MLFITTRPCPLTSTRIFSCSGCPYSSAHYRCNPAGAVLVISDIWRCGGRGILHLMPMRAAGESVRMLAAGRVLRSPFAQWDANAVWPWGAYAWMGA